MQESEAREQNSDAGSQNEEGGEPRLFCNSLAALAAC
jgi:hypothetical protein